MHNNTDRSEQLPYRSSDAPPPTDHKDIVRRPETARSTTEPPSAVFFSSPPAPRPTSSRRPHVRSVSLAAPPMARAHSLPTANSAARGLEFSSPSPPYGSLSPSPGHRTPVRVRSPFKYTQDEGYAPPRSPSWYESGPTAGGAIQSIQEDSELDITPRQQSSIPPSASFSRSGSLRRRPTSPLHSFANVPAIVQQAPTSFPANVIDQNVVINMNPPSTSTSSSPNLGAQKYNEAFPSALSLHHYASNSSFSSMSSTPSSIRSRSPSISSLDTIEDAPDLESEATEEDSQRLKLIAEGDEEDDGPRRRSLDVPRGFGFGRNGGSNRERKRWSICGGERRADLDLETIWED